MRYQIRDACLRLYKELRENTVTEFRIDKALWLFDVYREMARACEKCVFGIEMNELDRRRVVGTIWSILIRNRFYYL
jgi:hypothetical protein